MSTVVLTPTHIASDHCVVINTWPHETVVDPSYQKIFIAPDQTFIVALAGDFIPDKIREPDSFDFLYFLLRQIRKETFNASEVIVLEDSQVTGMKFRQVFSGASPVFFITADMRCIVYCGKKDTTLKVRRCADYAGMGSGGLIAVGMLLGGAKLDNLWGRLHQLVETTSEAHTIISLDILKPFDHPTEEQTA